MGDWGVGGGNILKWGKCEGETELGATRWQEVHFRHRDPSRLANTPVKTAKEQPQARSLGKRSLPLPAHYWGVSRLPPEPHEMAWRERLSEGQTHLKALETAATKHVNQEPPFLGESTSTALSACIESSAQLPNDHDLS